jgi:hypothetical protein
VVCISYKFCSIKQLLTTNTVDMLIIAETKIDNSFPDAQFKIDNYHFCRADPKVSIKSLLKLLSLIDCGLYKPDINHFVLLIRISIIMDSIVLSPTCFTKGAPATLNDVILTNRSTFCQNIQNFNCGLSDVHNIISVQIKGTIPRINKKFVEYRSFKNFDTLSYKVEILSKVSIKSLLKLLSLIDCGLNKPDINHFLKYL